METKIRPEELRIGNLVNRRYINPHPTNGNEVCYESCKVRALGMERVVVETNYGLIKLKYADISAIQLTEEWFLNNQFEKDVLEIIIDDNFKWVNGVLKYTASKSIYITCEFVHKLQTIYFAFTGQELIIQPKV